MRIIHLIDSGGVYGAERILLYLAREQQRRGDEPFVGSIGPPGTGVTEFERLAGSWGLPVVAIRIRSALTPAVVRSLLGTVRGLRPDVLHSHGYKANILLGLLPRRVRGAMLATLHGWTGGKPFTALGLREQLDGWALRNLDAVAVVAHAMLDLPRIRKVNRMRLQVIGNGIPPLDERISDLMAAGIAAVPSALAEFVFQAPTFVAIGRLSPEKGFELMIEAFARANSSNGDRHRLLIVGEGPERGRLERQIIELGLQNCVRLAGYVQGADRLLEHAAGFVMSSYTEGMPLVLLEAMQWPVPILATSVGGVPEILGANAAALLVPAQDLSALVNGLAVLMSSRRVISADDRAARTRAYTSREMAEKYSHAYLRIT
jgi:glycosyltransferase involved in cell wall biosynthesis